MARHASGGRHGMFGLHVREDGKGGFKAMGAMNKARQARDEFLDINPNMLFIVGLASIERHHTAVPNKPQCGETY